MSNKLKFFILDLADFIFFSIEVVEAKLSGRHNNALNNQIQENNTSGRNFKSTQKNKPGLK